FETRTACYHSRTAREPPLQRWHRGEMCALCALSALSLLSGQSITRIRSLCAASCRRNFLHASPDVRTSHKIVILVARRGFILTDSIARSRSTCLEQTWHLKA